jgi:hypothetical protein
MTARLLAAFALLCCVASCQPAYAAGACYPTRAALLHSQPGAVARWHRIPAHKGVRCWHDARERRKAFPRAVPFPRDRRVDVPSTAPSFAERFAGTEPNWLKFIQLGGIP